MADQQERRSMEDDESAPRQWWRSALRWAAEFAVYIVIAVLVVTLARLFLIQPFLVPSGSMEETLRNEDRILAWKPGEPSRGDIIVFRDDLGWLGPLTEEPAPWKEVLAWLKVLPPPDEQYLVKRLVGLPGDHVSCCDPQGRLSVNGQVLDESAYLYPIGGDDTVDPSLVEFDFVVPEGRVFVMGDHRNNSQDSRFWMCGRDNIPNPQMAFPTIDSIQGRVVAIMFPFSRMTGFETPSAFAQIPDSTADPPGVTDSQWTCPLRPS